jgi:hypothetical protein
MPTLIDVTLADMSPDVQTENPLSASPPAFEDGPARTLLMAANNAVDRVLSSDSAAFIAQNRQHEGE